MLSVAYLVNRYPEPTLTGIRREVEAVTSAGVSVARFAHRPSLQPLFNAVDALECQATEYLALTNPGMLAAAVLQALLTRPLRFFRAFRVAVATELSIVRSVSYLALACVLVRRLEARQISILHVHFGLTSAVVGLLARELGGPPWSVTVHGPEEFESGNRKRLARVARSATRTIAVSESSASALRDAALPARIEPRVIGLGVGRIFLESTQSINPDAAVVCIARLDIRKGHRVLLQALSLLDRVRQRIRVELIGNGPCRPELESEVLSRGLSDQVVFRGWLGETEVKEALDHARFLVLPSLSEGLPVAIMESFARGRPVLATDVAGIPELVSHRFNGIVVPPNDPGSLARGLEELLSMGADELLKLGLNGRRVIEERFDSERNARALVAVWQKMGNA